MRLIMNMIMNCQHDSKVVSNMLKSCSYCGRIHKRGERCPSKSSNLKKNTYIDKFRKTRQWRNKREQIVQRDKHLCQVCLRNQYNTQRQYNFDNLEVHHIVPIKDNWNKRLDDTNLITLCRYHHELAEKGEISAIELRGYI